MFKFILVFFVLLVFIKLCYSLFSSNNVKKTQSKQLSFLFNCSGVLLFIVLYWSLSVSQHKINPDDTTIPNFSQLYSGWLEITSFQSSSNSDILRESYGEVVLEANLKERLLSITLVKDLVATYGRLAKGLFWGCSMSIFIGLLSGSFSWFASLFIPPLSFLAKTPGTAMLAVFFVVIGTGEVMFEAMIAFGVLPILTQTIYLSARDDIHSEQIDKAYTLGASNAEVIFNIILPKILPKIIDGIRLQIGPAMVFLIAAEMLVGDQGMGYQIRIQQRLVQMNIVYIYLFILGLTGLFMDKFIISFRKKLCPWF